MKSIWMEPTDVLFFRDGRPLGSGSAWTGAPVFPPYPSVVYGALRTALLASKGIDWEDFRKVEIPVDLRELAGTPDRPGSFRLNGVYAGLFNDGKPEPLFPAPADVVQVKGGKALHLLEIADSGVFQTHPQPLAPLIARTRALVGPVQGFISGKGFSSWLAGGTPVEAEIVTTDSLFCVESRLGIGMDVSTRTAGRNQEDKGMLYTAGFVRMRMDRDGRAHGLLATVSGADPGVPSSGMLKLGGESRTAAFSTVETTIPQPPKGSFKFFKVCLATPGMFTAGWRPGSLAAGDAGWVWNGLGFKARLVAAAIGRPWPVGGFDVSSNWPKPVRPAAPAGSVYFCELIEGEFASVVREIHGNTISDEESDKAAGFGTAMVGVWKR